MNVVFYSKNSQKSGVGNYARNCIHQLSRFYPKSYFRLFNDQLNVKDVDVFHSLDAYLPSKITSSNAFKVITIEDMNVYHSASWLIKKWVIFKLKKAIKKANLIIAYSNQAKSDIIKLYGISDNKIRVIYPFSGLEFKTDYSENDVFEIQNKFKLPKRFILNVGDIEEYNNQLSLVKAIYGTSIPLVLVGLNSKYLRKIGRFIKKNKITNQVIVIERLTAKELALVYHLSSAVVFLSEYVGGVKEMISALQSKTVLIVSNSDGFIELAGQEPVYINAHSIGDIKAKVQFIWDNPSDGARRIEKSISHTAQFQNENIAAQLMDVYKSLGN